MTYHSDYKNLLFSKDEIFSLLSKAGFPLSDTNFFSADQSQAPYKPVQQWMRLYAAKGALRIHEAAWILANEEPIDHYPNTNILGKENLIKNIWFFVDLVEAGEVECLNTSSHIDDEPQTWLIDHKSILRWGQKTRYEWPLAELMQNSSEPSSLSISSKPNSEIDIETSIPEMDILRKKVDELEEEIAQLRSKIEEIGQFRPLHPEYLLGAAIATQRKYWASWDGARAGGTKSIAIKDYIRSTFLGQDGKNLSTAEVNAIEKVACPFRRGNS
ncbi:hypothetical protein [Halotalea alkalilenta]|uniref:hypothetical protein n=1 Tax=Halotalea alkalilenta TaxID=376489 RepID=UPI00123717A1|nr:hypothetical protein [Halotalea alkalilenta]